MRSSFNLFHTWFWRYLQRDLPSYYSVSQTLISTCLCHTYPSSWVYFPQLMQNANALTNQHYTHPTLTHHRSMTGRQCSPRADHCTIRRLRTWLVARPTDPSPEFKKMQWASRVFYEWSRCCQFGSCWLEDWVRCAQLFALYKGIFTISSNLKRVLWGSNAWNNILLGCSRVIHGCSVVSIRDGLLGAMIPMGMNNPRAGRYLCLTRCL